MQPTIRHSSRTILQYDVITSSSLNHLTSLLSLRMSLRLSGYPKHQNFTRKRIVTLLILRNRRRKQLPSYFSFRMFAYHCDCLPWSFCFYVPLCSSFSLYRLINIYIEDLFSMCYNDIVLCFALKESSSSPKLVKLLDICRGSLLSVGFHRCEAFISSSLRLVSLLFKSRDQPDDVMRNAKDTLLRLLAHENEQVRAIAYQSCLEIVTVCDFYTQFKLL